MRIATTTFAPAVSPDSPGKSARANRKERVAKRDAWLREIDPGCQFHLLFDLIPGVYFFAKDRQGEFMFLGRNNRERCHLKDDAAVIGLNDFDVNPPDVARSYVLDDARIYATGEPLLNRVELLFDHLGIPGWFVVNKLPIWSRSGEIIGIMGFSQSYDGRAQMLQPFHSISKAVQYIRANYQQAVTLGRLAVVAGLSTRQLQRKFKTVFGFSPHQFLVRTRLLAGCRLLSETQKGVGEIAYVCGFGDQSAFAHHFRQNIGMTPSQYRAREPFVCYTATPPTLLDDTRN